MLVVKTHYAGHQTRHAKGQTQHANGNAAWSFNMWSFQTTKLRNDQYVGYIGRF
jgi:hypothetical protein